MKLFTKTVCPKCILVKNELEKIDIEYEIVNIDQDSKARDVLIEQGIMAVPVLEIEGEFLSDVTSIRQAINDVMK